MVGRDIALRALAYDPESGVFTWRLSDAGYS
jgi:hypothetical protein